MRFSQNIQIHLSRLEIDIDIISDTKIVPRLIRRKYHALSLIHHPDKPTGDAAKFIELKESYNFLKENEKEVIDYIDNMTRHKGLYELYNKSLSALTNFVSSAIDKYSYQTFILNPSIDQLFNRELYCHKDEKLNQKLYIPLWHSSIEFEEHKLRFDIQPSLPAHVQIEENNDIIVFLHVSNIEMHKKVSFDIGSKSFSFVIDKKTYYSKKYVFESIGIPSFNMNNIYDCNYFSNIVVYF
jgi:hypothetical protein